MKIIVSFIFAFLFTFSLLADDGYKIGDAVNSFTLTNVDGKEVSLADYDNKEGIILIFTCNHCPYAKMYESRIMELHEKYGDKYPVIAVNPNDPKKYPEDNFENMKKRAKEKGYKFPYVVDEDQEVARSFGATKTPDVFLLHKVDGEFVLKYKGAIDNNYKSGSKASEKYVENAIMSLEQGEEIDPESTKAVGCGIKWK